MKDRNKTGQQLISEIEELREQIKRFETSEAECKQTDDVIRKQGEFLNRVIESLPHPFYVIDANDYTVKMANSAAVSGSLRENQTCYALTHHRNKPCSGAKHPCPLQEVKKTGKPVVIEHIHYDKDGNARNVEVHGFPIFDSKGNVIQMVENCLDITERKQAEEALRSLSERESNSAREWQELFDASLDIVALISPDFEILRINRAGYEGMGRKREELIGKKCYEVVHGLHSPIDGCPCQESIRTKKAGVGEITQWGRHYMTTASPVLDKNGELTAFAHTVKDITESKRAEEKLRESEERYQVLFHSGNDAVFVYHPTPENLPGQFIEVNDAACEMLGYSRDELLKLSPMDIIDPGRAKVSPPETMKRLVTEKRLLTESVFVSKDGREIPIERSIRLFEFKGRPTVLTIARDITERKRVEQKLEEDQQKIRELAAAYVHAQEQEREWVALEIHDRTVQTLTAIFHHLQALEPLTDHSPDTRQAVKHILTLMKQAIRETRGIIKHLYPETLAKFGLAALIDEELHRFRNETGCQVKFDNNCPKRLPKNIEVTLYRIFHEALLNINKHAGSVGMVAVLLAYKNGIAELLVEDDGAGFNIEAKRRGKSPGGLESMRRRAQIIGGTFDAASISGQGTKITVRIPAVIKSDREGE